MTVDLSMLPLEDLLRKFSAGGHKPGSGSAAALLGLMSCALTRTVISLSRQREAYASVWKRLDAIATSITDEIEPALWKAFDDDSVQFDKVISARRARDDEHDPSKRWGHARQASKEIYGASEIPILIAEKCLALAEHSMAVFDIGFKSARGDSHVAIDSALSGAMGSISIVYLNLGTLCGHPKATQLLGHAQQLEARANELASELQNKTIELKSKAESANNGFHIDLKAIRDPRRSGSKYTDRDIEKIARNTQGELWLNRKHIWSDRQVTGPIDVLEPPDVFRVLGYQFDNPATLGQIIDGRNVTEVAGYINKSKNYVAVSTQFPIAVQRFTAAHELGHAVLHKANEQFRDRGLDGSLIRGPRERVEHEADKFAVYFLMPESIMRDTFKQIFRSDEFVVSDDTAFALGLTNFDQLIKECPTIRHVSRRLARTAMFLSKPARSLVDIFGVSHEAMAIRIEELHLLNTNGYRFDQTTV